MCMELGWCIRRSLPIVDNNMAVETGFTPPTLPALSPPTLPALTPSPCVPFNHGEPVSCEEETGEPEFFWGQHVYGRCMVRCLRELVRESVCRQPCPEVLRALSRMIF